MNNRIKKLLSHYKAKNFVVAFFMQGGTNGKEKKEKHIHSRDMPNFRRNDTDKRKVIKDKKGVFKKGADMAVRKGANTTLNQLEGGEEAESVLITAAVVTSPVRKIAKKQAEQSRNR